MAVAVVVAATVAATAASALGRRIYGGQVDILVNTRGYDSEAASTRLLTTQKVILESERVLGSVGRIEHMSFRDLRHAISTEVVGQTEILRVTVGDAHRARAQRLAEAVAESYVTASSPPPRVPDPETAAVAASLADVRARNAPLEAARTAGAESAPPGPDEQRLVAEESTLAAHLNALQAGQAAAAPGPKDVRVLSPARLLDHPIRPRPLQAAAGGFLVGLFLASGVLFATWAARRRPWVAWT